MANAYTDITSGASLGVELVKTGYEKLVAFKLRSEPLFRRVADTRATALTNPGSTVVFNLYNDLTPDSTNISETVNPDSEAVPATDTVSVTINEMGSTVIPTLRLRTLTFSDIDPAVANLVARKLAESVDLRVRNALDAGTQVANSNAGAPVTGEVDDNIAATDTFKSQIPQTLVAKMRGANVIEKMDGNTFGAFIHPDVAYDLRRETGELGWRYPHNNVAPDALWKEQVGVFGGVSYIETPRARVQADAGSTGTVDVYTTYLFGSQALAEVVAIEPHLVIGPVVDPMMRFRPLSWHGLAGWSVYREEALWRVKSSSSIASF